MEEIKNQIKISCKKINAFLFFRYFISSHYLKRTTHPLPPNLVSRNNDIPLHISIKISLLAEVNNPQKPR